MNKTTHCSFAARAQHWLMLERLELRTLLSASAGSQEPFAPGEVLIGFEGDVAAAFASQGAEEALELAQRIVGPAGLHSGRILYGLPARVGQAARVATHWELPPEANVPSIAIELSQQPGIAYAEPNVILTSQSIPGDASFAGDWQFGEQEHLPQIGAPEAWDVTTGDPSVIVAVIDTGVDLDHPDLDGNLLPGTTFVEGTTTAQDDNGHGTQIAGLIAAEMNNLTDLASEADGDATWAGGVVGVAPNVSILPVKVLNHGGNGLVSDIATGINYAVDPDGNPDTEDGVDVITLSLGGAEASQLVADAIANAYDQGVLVIASVASTSDPDIFSPAMEPWALGVTAVNADDGWDGTSQMGSFVDLSAPGVDVLTTFVDLDDPLEAIARGGAYGRESGASMAAPIVAGAAALVKSQHPDWGPNEIAGQLLATTDSINTVNDSRFQGQLGAGRVSASAAVGSTARPRVISLVGLGDTDADTPELLQLETGDVIGVRFSHAMDATRVLDASRYQLRFLGDPATPDDDQVVELSLITEPLPPDATGVTDADNYYVPFPGRGVQLRVDGIGAATSLPSGVYELTVRAMPSVGSGTSRSFTHEFKIAPRAHFGEQQVVTQADAASPMSVFAADLDGDGDLDMLSASSVDDKIAWYENTDGRGNFGRQQVITQNAAGQFGMSVVAADLDGDGDQDVLSASDWDDKIAWYENIDGKGTFGPQQVITQTLDAVRDLSVGDLDGDGDLDVVSRSRYDNTIVWYENSDAKGTFDQAHAITLFGGSRTVAEVHTADLDGDGDLDLLTHHDDRLAIVLYENTDGTGRFTPRLLQTFAATGGIRNLRPADFDGDGDLDVVASENYRTELTWYENTDGLANFGQRRVAYKTEDEHIFYLQTVGDVDGDGDLDVLLTEGPWLSRLGEREGVWHENVDGMFGEPRAISSDFSAGSLADLDGDGDLDLFSAFSSEDKIAWYENTNGLGDFGPQQAIVSADAADVRSALAADLDGDLDLDLISASFYDDKVAWYENTDGHGTFGEQQVITDSADRAVSVAVADLDGDGDVDVLSASQNDAKFAWYENMDGLGTFGPQRVITLGGEDDYGVSVTTADIDGDGDQDVLVIWRDSRGENTLAWYENADGNGNFGEEKVIARVDAHLSSISVGDLDGDGDIDVLGGWQVGGNDDPDTIVWYENTDGAGNFGEQQVITASVNYPESVAIADLDGDGDQDVLSASSADDTIAWYENIDGTGNFGPQQVITTSADGARLVAVADLDDDGDFDVLAGWRKFPDPGAIAWFDNDGAGNFGSQLLITTPYPTSVGAADIDGDSDLDVYSSSRSDSKIAWYENLLAHPGDANRDGRFDTTDLVQVFVAGEYEDGIPGNSTWEEGDWNGDGDFDSGDLVAAFTKGLYERTSRVVASKVAAAVDWLFAEDDERNRCKAYVA